MYKKVLFIIIVLLAVSCKEDVLVVSYDGDFPIVYGLLDVNDSIHYVRIQKSAVDEVDAYDIISNENNMSLSVSNVFVNEYVDNVFTRSFELELVDSIEKEQGDFPALSNSIYSFEAKLESEATYELNITTPDYELISSTTELVHKMQLYFVDRMLIYKDLPFSIKWVAPVNGIYFEIRLGFHLRRNYDGEYKQEYYEYFVGSKTSYSNVGGETNVIELTYENYKFLLDEYIFDTIHSTYIDKIDLIFSAATEEFLIFKRSASATGTGMVERRVFNNISNGKGLFTSRQIIVVEDIQIILIE